MQVDRWLTVAGILSLLNIPFSYLYFKELSDTIAPRESGWRQIRIAANKANISGQGALSIESLILPFLTIIALIAVYEYADTGRRGPRTLFLVLLAGGYQLLNGARSEVLLLLVSSVVILWLKKGDRTHSDCLGSWASYFFWSSLQARFPWANMAPMREHPWLTIFLEWRKVSALTGLAGS